VQFALSGGGEHRESVLGASSSLSGGPSMNGSAKPANGGGGFALDLCRAPVSMWPLRIGSTIKRVGVDFRVGDHKSCARHYVAGQHPHPMLSLRSAPDGTQ